MKTTRTVLTLTATTALALSLGACGSSGGGSTGAGSGSGASATSSSPSSPMTMSSGTMSSGTMSSGTMSSKSPSAAAPVKVTIKNFMFEIPGSVSPGAKVTVTNTDTTNHTFTLKAAGVDAKVEAGGGTTTITAPSKPGSYQVTCDYHANMLATLVVK